MTEREIAVRTEASRGRLCARMTRIEGRLVTLPPGELEPGGQLGERRAPSVAAALVTAFLGVGGGAVQASATSGSEDVVAASSIDAAGEASSAPVVTFNEDVKVIGEAPVIDESRVTMGIIAFSPDPLRVAFEHSNLTILATVDNSRWIERDEDGYGRVATELRIQEVLRGSVKRRFRPPFRSVIYVHHESIDLDEQGGEAPSAGSNAPQVPGPTVGSTVLAFLDPSTERRRLQGLPVYELGANWYSLKELTPPEVSAYRERLSSLATVLGPEEISPAEVAEWLVATAEEPLTRAEVMEELDDDAVLEVLTEAQRQRLLLSLLATDGMTGGDLSLFDFVNDYVVDEADIETAAAIRGWLRRQLTRDLAESTDPQSWFNHWAEIAGRLGESLVRERAEEAEAALEAFYEASAGGDYSTTNLERVLELARPLAEEHRQRIAAALGEAG